MATVGWLLVMLVGCLVSFVAGYFVSEHVGTIK